MVADLAGARDVMRDGHDGRLHLAADPEDHVRDDIGHDGVQSRVGLVEEQNFGLVGGLIFVMYASGFIREVGSDVGQLSALF